MAVVRAALITPLSGSLAEFGRATARALQLWAEQCAGPEQVRLQVHDARPRPADAVRRAEQDDPDLLFGPYGSGTAEAVADAATRLVWNHSGATATDRPNTVDLLAPASTYFDGAVRAVHRADPGRPRFCVLHNETGFGRDVADGAARAAAHLGHHAETAVLPAAPSADADVLLVAGRFRGERAAARRYWPGRWRAAGFVGAGVDDVLANLGSRREGLLGPAQWMASAAPEPDEGPPAPEFARAYRRSSGQDPPYPAAQAFSAGLIAGRCLREAGSSEDGALLRAARRLDRTTLFGRFRLDPDTGRQVGHRVLTVQWQEGQRVVVWPPERAGAQLRHPLP